MPRNRNNGHSSNHTARSDVSRAILTSLQHNCFPTNWRRCPLSCRIPPGTNSRCALVCSQNAPARKSPRPLAASVSRQPRHPWRSRPPRPQRQCRPQPVRPPPAAPAAPTWWPVGCDGERPGHWSGHRRVGHAAPGAPARAVGPTATTRRSRRATGVSPAAAPATDAGRAHASAARGAAPETPTPAPWRPVTTTQGHTDAKGETERVQGKREGVAKTG